MTDARFRRGAGVVNDAASSEPARATSFSKDLVLFLAANLFAISWVLAAMLQPWIASGSDPVPDSLLRKWLPLALVLATIGTAVVARALTPAERTPVLARHFLVYLVPLALLLIDHFGGPHVLNGQLGAIYLLIPLAFSVHAVAALWPAVERLTDRAAAIQLATIALVAAVALLPYHRAVMPTASDEPHYLIVVESLAYDHDLDLTNDYGGDRYLAFYPTRLPDIHGIHVGSAIYSIRDMGLPLLAAIPFAIAGRLGVLALMCLVGAALAVQLYLLARDLGFARRTAFLGAATTALVHPVLTYTTQVYPELLTALAFVTAVRVLRAGTRSTLRDLAVSSALVGTLPWLSTRAWPIAAGVGLVIAYCALRPQGAATFGAVARRVAAGALPFTLLVLALCALNWRLFGLFMPAAGYFLIRENQPVLTYTLQIGGPGLLFDRTFGLIPRAPVYLLGFLGIPLLLRRARSRPAETIALAAGGLLSYVYIADIAYWWADGSPPSRYLLGSLPLFVPAVAAGWEVVLGDALPRAWRGLARAAAWLALAASAAAAYLFAVLPNTRYDLATEIQKTGSSGAFFELIARSLGVDPGRAFPSLVRVDPPSVALAVGWIALAAILAVVPLASLRRARAQVLTDQR